MASVVLQVAIAVTPLARLSIEKGFIWLVFLVFMLIAIESILRVLADGFHDYSQLCRRVSRDAYASGQDIDDASRRDIASQEPWAIGLLGYHRTNLSLAEYYGHQDITIGPERLRAICAYSAFFSHRLMRLYLVFMLMWFFVFFVGGLTALIYLSGSETTSLEARLTSVDVLLTVVWAFFAIRTLQTAFRAYLMYQSVFRIEQLLCKSQATSAREINQLAAAYDFNRANTFKVPSVIYRIYRNKIEAKWKDLGGVPPS